MVKQLKTEIEKVKEEHRCECVRDGGETEQDAQLNARLSTLDVKDVSNVGEFRYVS